MDLEVKFLYRDLFFTRKKEEIFRPGKLGFLAFKKVVFHHGASAQLWKSLFFSTLILIVKIGYIEYFFKMV